MERNEGKRNVARSFRLTLWERCFRFCIIWYEFIFSRRSSSHANRSGINNFPFQFLLFHLSIAFIFVPCRARDINLCENLLRRYRLSLPLYLRLLLPAQIPKWIYKSHLCKSIQTPRHPQRVDVAHRLHLVTFYFIFFAHSKAGYVNASWVC